MLTSLIIAFIFLSGHSSAVIQQLDATEKAIKKDVANKTTQEQALKIVNAMQTTEKDFQKAQENDAKGLDAVTAKRTATATDIEAPVTKLLANDSATMAKMTDLRFQLRTTLGADDWAKVMAPPPPKK